MLISVPLLIGCGDGELILSRDEVITIADDISVDNNSILLSRIEDLERRLDENEEAINDVRGLGLENARNVAAASQQIDRNAQVSNSNSLRDMTHRGACGYRSINRNLGGGITVTGEPIPCTEADLRND